MSGVSKKQKGSGTLSAEQRSLVENNLNLVCFVLKKLGIRHGDHRYEDLFSCGCLALCGASLRYRPGRCAFSTFAYYCIRRELMRMIAKDRREANKTVPLDSDCAQLMVCESGYEAVEAALLVKEFFGCSGLAPPALAPEQKKKAWAAFAAWI